MTFVTPDEQTIANLLQTQWGLPERVRPSITWRPQSYFQQGRAGGIHVYPMSTNTTVSTTDYTTTNVFSYVGIKIFAPSWEVFLLVSEEVRRILIDNRRAGPDVLGGYSYLEIPAFRRDTSLSGSFTATIDLRLSRFHDPLTTNGILNEDEMSKLLDKVLADMGEEGYVEPVMPNII